MSISSRGQADGSARSRDAASDALAMASWGDAMIEGFEELRNGAVGVI